MPPPPDDHINDERDRRNRLTKTQRVFWEMLTDQRVANLIAASDLVGDLDADAINVLRHLGREDAKPLREFLFSAKPETLDFLTDLRRKEIADIAEAIEAGLALRRVLRFMKFGVATLFAAFVGMSLLWEKLTAFFKGSGTMK